jgi:hypothetical protein
MKFTKPTVFTVTFAFVVTAATLKYMTLGVDGFYTCGLPFQYVQQIPIEGETQRMGFNLHYHWLVLDLLIWYVVGWTLQRAVQLLRRTKK